MSLNKKINFVFILFFFIFIFFIAKSQLVSATCCCRAERPVDKKIICKDVDNCDNGNYNPCFDWAQQQGYKNINYGNNLTCPDDCKDMAVNFKGTNMVVPQLSIPIPGLNLTSDKDLLRVCAECREAVAEGSKCPDEKCVRWTYQIPWIGEYIFAFYKWAVSAIAIFAVLVIIYAGFGMVLAAGNSAKLTAARDSIFAGVIGLMLILVMHQVLFMIDPRLVVLKPIVIWSIKRVELLTMESDVEEGTVIPSSGNGLNPSITAVCFPVGSSSFNYISWNWGNKRSDGKRCHAGIDIFTKGLGQVFAMADGKVINNFFFYKCSGGNTNAIMVDHGSFIALYGEINSDTAKITTGSVIKAGQFLGNATYCEMLHFELYNKGTATNYRWSPPSGKTVGSESNYCKINYLSTKPSLLLDPTETIKNLQGKYCQ